MDAGIVLNTTEQRGIVVLNPLAYGALMNAGAAEHSGRHDSPSPIRLARWYLLQRFEGSVITGGNYTPPGLAADWEPAGRSCSSPFTSSPGSLLQSTTVGFDPDVPCYMAVRRVTRDQVD